MPVPRELTGRVYRAPVANVLAEQAGEQRCFECGV